MASQSGSAPVRLALVGGGPRAVGVLARLAARATQAQVSGGIAEAGGTAAAQPALPADRPLRIDLVDPHMPGSGRIWRTDESPLLLMNSRAADVTVFTDETVAMDGPVLAGPSLAEWAAEIREGRLTAPTVGSERLAEIEAITPTSFVSRRAAALYLEWFLGEVLASLPATVEVHVHRTTATALRALAEDGPWQVRLEGRPALTADLVLLAAGHTDARPDEGPLDWLHDPLQDLGPDAGPEGTRAAVLAHVAADLRARTGADVPDAERRVEATHDARALFQLLLRLHGAPVDLLPAHRVRGGAAGDHPRWWHSLFSFVASGPPPHRLQQLLALERAGVVSFLGPGLRVEADEATGRFRARSASGVQVTADALLEAHLPAPTLADSANPLLRDLVTGARGGVAVGREAVAAPGRLDVDEEHHVIAPDGSVHRTVWALGPWTAELPVGAFARPRTNAPAFRRNDRVAGALLAEVRAVAARRRADAASTPRTDEIPAATGPHLAVRGAARPPRLGLLGPGKLGTALARTALRAGVEVVVASRQDPRHLRRRLPGSQVTPAHELGAAADVVVLAVPLHVALALDPESLRGTVVIDATNAWGTEDEAALAAVRHRVEGAEEWGTSELLATCLPGAEVVKTLNHIGYHDLEDHGREAGHEERRAIAVASDHERAAELAAALLHRLGYDAARAGSLADGRRFEPAGGLFSGWRTLAELTALAGVSADGSAVRGTSVRIA